MIVSASVSGMSRLLASIVSICPTSYAIEMFERALEEV